MKTQKLIVIAGLPGSGKSTLAERLAQELGAPILSVDPIESAVIKAGFAKGFKSGLAAYMVAENLTREQLQVGHSVIIDAVNAEDEAKQTWTACAKALRVPLVVIECVLGDEKLHRARIGARVRSLHGFEEITWAQVQARRKAYTPWPVKTLQLEMSQPLDQNVQRALELIETQPNQGGKITP